MTHAQRVTIDQAKTMTAAISAAEMSDQVIANCGFTAKGFALERQRRPL